MRDKDKGMAGLIGRDVTRVDLTTDEGHSRREVWFDVKRKIGCPQWDLHLWFSERGD